MARKARLRAQIRWCHEIAPLEAPIEVREVAEARLERDCGDRPGGEARARQHHARHLEPALEGKVREGGSGFLEQHLDIARRDALTRSKLVKTERGVLDQIGL